MAKKPKEGLEGYCPQKHSKTSIKKVGMCKLIHPSIHPSNQGRTHPEQVKENKNQQTNTALPPVPHPSIWGFSPQSGHTPCLTH